MARSQAGHTGGRGSVTARSRFAGALSLQTGGEGTTGALTCTPGLARRGRREERMDHEGHALTDRELLELLHDAPRAEALTAAVRVALRGASSVQTPDQTLQRRLFDALSGGPGACVQLELQVAWLAPHCTASGLAQAAKVLADRDESWWTRLRRRLAAHQEVAKLAGSAGMRLWLHALLAPNCPPAWHPTLSVHLKGLDAHPRAGELARAWRGIAQDSLLHAMLADRVEAAVAVAG